MQLLRMKKLALGMRFSRFVELFLHYILVIAVWPDFEGLGRAKVDKITYNKEGWKEDDAVCGFLGYFLLAVLCDFLVISQCLFSEYTVLDDFGVGAGRLTGPQILED